MSSEDNKYAILSEKCGKYNECWYTFINVKDNMEALLHLKKQLDSVDYYIVGDLSVFDLDLETLLGSHTAREMTRLKLNYKMNHRKFDGKMEMVDLGFKDSDTNRQKIIKTFGVIGIGSICNYLDERDYTHDEDDETDDSDYAYKSQSSSDEDGEDNSDTTESSSSESEEEEKNIKRPSKDELKQRVVERLRRRLEKLKKNNNSK